MRPRYWAESFQVSLSESYQPLEYCLTRLWSSSENNNNNAWNVRLSNGNANNNNKASNAYGVRAFLRNFIQKMKTLILENQIGYGN